MGLRLKTLFVSLVLFYTVYLFSYKCPSVAESPLQHTVESVLHPLSHHHNQLCDGLSRGQGFVAPYTAKVHGFLDEHVHSHALFKKYDIAGKATCAQSKYSTYVAPHVLKLWQAVEVAEVYVYDHAVQVYGLIKAQYDLYLAPHVNEAYSHVEPYVAKVHSVVEPKIAEAKSFVTPKVEQATEGVKEAVESVL